MCVLWIILCRYTSSTSSFPYASLISPYGKSIWIEMFALTLIYGKLVFNCQSPYEIILKTIISYCTQILYS